MRRILLLGGIGEALELASKLGQKHQLTYSLVGRARIPKLSCRVRVGGFGGTTGLAKFLHEENIDLLIDATHPYAAQISRHAAMAAQQTQTPLWAYRRPPWQPNSEDDWRPVTNWHELKVALSGFQRPFFTIGLEPLHHANTIPQGQRWLVRVLTPEFQPMPRLNLIGATGPFSLVDELALLRAYSVDILVSKNSGGSAVAAKLGAARIVGIPVVMLERPGLPQADQEFANVDALARCLGC